MTQNQAEAAKKFTAVPGRHTGPVSKILIANRGEIAVRVIRAARLSAVSRASSTRWLVCPSTPCASCCAAAAWPSRTCGYRPRTNPADQSRGQNTRADAHAGPRPRTSNTRI